MLSRSSCHEKKEGEAVAEVAEEEKEEVGQEREKGNEDIMRVHTTALVRMGAWQ